MGLLQLFFLLLLPTTKDQSGALDPLTITELMLVSNKLMEMPLLLLPTPETHFLHPSSNLNLTLLILLTLMMISSKPPIINQGNPVCSAEVLMKEKFQLDLMVILMTSS